MKKKADKIFKRENYINLKHIVFKKENIHI